MDRQPHRPPSILVIRLSAIGDVVMASPLIRALRRGYPDARIAWMVQPESQDLLKSNAALDEVIVWPRNEWKRLSGQGRWSTLLREVFRFTTRLRERRFDMSIDIQGLLKSAVWGWLSRAPRRIGLRPTEGSGAFLTEMVPGPEDTRRIGSEYLYLAETLGLPTDSFDMDVAVSEEDARFASEWVEREGLHAGYAALCPFTTRPQKEWPIERWRGLASAVRRELGLVPVLLGGPGDRAAADEIAGTETTALNLVGATKIGQASAVIRSARLLVGVDTGLTHMGLAFDVPSVVLFGSTCPYLNPGRKNAVILYKDLTCAPCHRNPTCDGAFTCMKEIGVDEVTAAAVGVMG
jgi:heptosyltransferase-1